MDSAARRPVSSSLFTQMLALVLVALVVSQIVSLALQRLLPPQPPPVMVLESFARRVQSDAEGLLTITAASPPRPDAAEESIAEVLERRIARLLQRPLVDVAVDPAPEQEGRLSITHQSQGGAEAGTPVLIGQFRVGIRQPDGLWTVYQPLEQHAFGSDSSSRFLLLFLLNGAIMLPLVWWFARRLSRPLEQLADAAEHIGHDPDSPTPAIAGSSEVERAAVALAAMQQRLSSFVTERTRMLGAIAHDLRTPLTRLAFRAEQLSGAEGTALRADVREMSAMVESSLAYVRGADREAGRRRLELGALAEGVAQDLIETGRAVHVTIESQAIVRADPVSIRRIVGNLINNALFHGGSAEVCMTTANGLAILDILDDGDGAPGQELERLFEPFVRADAARSRHTGGTGLGLPVARSLARAHGGDVVLERRPEGGMRARLTLPLAA